MPYCRQCHRQRPPAHFEKPGHYTTDGMYEDEGDEATRPARSRNSQQQEGGMGAWVGIGLTAAASLAGLFLLWKQGLGNNRQPPQWPSY